MCVFIEILCNKDRMKENPHRSAGLHSKPVGGAHMGCWTSSGCISSCFSAGLLFFLLWALSWPQFVFTPAVGSFL